MPIYPSPLKDDGYDIADYCNIAGAFGTLDDFKGLLAAAHSRGMRLIMDLVMNHTSDEHPWFQAARSDRKTPYRDYYVWSDTAGNIRTPASSSSTPNLPTGPGTKWRVSITGTVFTPANPI